MKPDVLGAKIKSLRKLRKMTQSELSESFITRNMLSRIENGTASPSLETLCNIARRLEISPGWLLDDSAELFQYEKYKTIKKIKSLFASDDYFTCESECAALLSEGGDDELYIISAECSYRIAIKKLEEGRFVSADKWFRKTLEYTRHGVISSRASVDSAEIYLKYIKLFFSGSRLHGDFGSCDMPFSYPPYEGAMCVKLNAMIKSGEAANVRSLLNAGAVSGCYAEQISAALAYAEGDTDTAAKKYEGLFTCGDIPAEIMYIVSSELEKIARHREDYKLAYACAEKKLELINTAGK